MHEPSVPSSGVRSNVEGAGNSPGVRPPVSEDEIALVIVEKFPSLSGQVERGGRFARTCWAADKDPSYPPKEDDSVQRVYRHSAEYQVQERLQVPQIDNLGMEVEGDDFRMRFRRAPSLVQGDSHEPLGFRTGAGNRFLFDPDRGILLLRVLGFWNPVRLQEPGNQPVDFADGGRESDLSVCNPEMPVLGGRRQRFSRIELLRERAILPVFGSVLQVGLLSPACSVRRPVFVNLLRSACHD